MTVNTKISTLTSLNVDALRQALEVVEMPVTLTKTTAEWELTAREARELVEKAKAMIPGAAQEHPRKSLNAVIRKLAKAAEQQATQQAAGKVAASIATGEDATVADALAAGGEVDVSDLGDQAEAHMANAVLADTRGLAKGDVLLAAWEPSDAGQDGIPFAWRIRRDGAGKHQLERTTAMPPKWEVARTITKTEATGLIGQLQGRHNIDAAFAAEEIIMAKTATRAAATKTATASKTTTGAKAQTGSAPMQAAAAKAEGKQLQAELVKAIKGIRGVTAKPSPKGDYTTFKVGTTPIAYTTIRKDGVLLELALPTAPEGVELTFVPCPKASPRFGTQATVKSADQADQAKAAVEAAAKAAAK